MGISIGNKIELVLLDQIIRNDENKKVYVSKIYDIMQNDVLQVAMPIYDGKIVPLSVNDKYSACFYTDRGLLQCNVIVTARYKSGNLFFLEVRMLNELSKVQRRAYYRYTCLLDGKLRIVSDDEFTTGMLDDPSISELDLPWEDIKILDISGGGAKIVAHKHIDRDEVGKIRFMVAILDEIVSFNLFARVLSSTPIKGRVGLYELRLEFMKITPDDRDKIIKFIFESERVARAKDNGMI